MHDGQAVDNDSGLIVGKDSVALRTVWPEIEGKLRCECILDGGSQIIAMKESIWEQLGNNLQTDMSIKMESANATITPTAGRLRNVRFTFGDLDIFLQVQVMRHAPYDVLLGRPFETLTSSTIKNWSNGDQHLTITDPNSGRTVTIPTHERKRARRKNTDPDF